LNIKIENEAKDYLRKTGTTRLLIDMTPDLTNSGCGCGKTKKFYTPFIREMKPDEHFKNYTIYQTDIVDVYLSPKALEGAEDIVTIKLEKTLFFKKLEVQGIQFIVE